MNSSDREATDISLGLPSVIWHLFLLVLLVFAVPLTALLAALASTPLLGFNMVGVVAVGHPLYEDYLPEPEPVRTIPPEAAHYLMTEYPELYNQETMRSGR